MPEVEVRIVNTVLIVDKALQHICATFREEADRGDITPTERDLLIDGAILLAMNVDDMAREDRAGPDSGRRRPPELAHRPPRGASRLAL